MYKPQFRAFSQNPIYIEIKDIKATITKPSKEPTKIKAIKKELGLNDYMDLFNKPIRDLSKYSTQELNTLRNAIFAYVGLDFRDSNIALYDRFSKFSWYKPTIKSGAVAYSKLTPLQKANVQALLQEEKRRLGGLTLSDCYRVNIKKLDSKYLKRYSKKELKILRNSLIARYGYKFRDKELRAPRKTLYTHNELCKCEIVQESFKS